MKKIAMLLCVVLLVGVVAGCSESSATGSESDYKAVIEAARPAELNEIPNFEVVNGPESEMYELVFSETFGFVAEDMQRYAISVSMVNTQAYGVAIVLPAEGKQQAVIDQMNAFVEMQKQAMENYLIDQYEIAAAAIVQTMPTGEVIMVMCEDAESVLAAIEEGL